MSSLHFPKGTGSVTGGALATAPAKPPTDWSSPKVLLPAALGLASLFSGVSGASGDNTVQSGPTAAQTRAPEAPMPRVNFDRKYVGPTNPASYYNWGTAPSKFFENNSLRTEAESQPATGPGFALGGDVRSGGSTYMGSGGARTSGRSDSIPARLSPKEYVMDAESMALLGDGNPDAGADQMDQLRKRLRQHKGKALAAGKFTPAARKPEAYMHKGKR